MWRELDAFAPRESAWERGLRFGLIAGFHGLVIAVALTVVVRPEVRETARQIRVRMLEDTPPQPPKVEPMPPQPQAQVARPALRRPVRPSPAPPATPIVTAVSEAAAPAPAFVVPLRPAPPAAEVESEAPPPAPAAPLVAARFDADYLRNPKPLYPAQSRRMGEEGRVILLVRVLADGSAASVQVKTGSGSARLDQAALEAVRQWRFVPARRGDDALDSAVLVPISFALDR